MLLLFIGASLSMVLFYLYIMKPLKYWKNRGIEQGNPKWFFGHFWEFFIGKKSGIEITKQIYEQNPHSRYVGMYRFSTPVLLVKDPELIKQITVKDFEYFADHVDRIPADSDPLWAKNLFNLKGSKWRDMRAHLSPCFTSGKMRSIFVMMTKCAENLLQHLLDKDQDVVTVEMRDTFSRYANDVIASTAFGVKVDSLAQLNNKFYQMGNEVADFSSFWKTVKIVAFWLIPPIKNFVKIQIISDDVSAYFREIIDEVIKTREEEGILRLDMLHLLLLARKEMKNEETNWVQTNVNDVHSSELTKKNLLKKKVTGHHFQGKDSKPYQDLSNEDITAHALIFFIAGFESVTTFISFATYELAVNPDVQEKLKEEVLVTWKECEGKLTYEAILKMKYMDMVLAETLRKWPHFTGIERTCTKPYTIAPAIPGEKPAQIEVGTEIRLSMFAMHHDSKYFPDPERFDPKRFSEDNKGSIHAYTYFPFGLGPRNCIGSKFVLLEAKIVLYYLLSRFEIVPVEKTGIPVQLAKSAIFNLKPKGGMWIGFKQYRE